MSLDKNTKRIRNCLIRTPFIKLIHCKCYAKKYLQSLNNRDLGFLQGILNEESCPEYKGFNTALMRNGSVAMSPPTTVTYIPLINMNHADPDKILTSMYKVIQLTDEAGQKYSLFTNDQQPYRITQQVTWWKSEK